MTTRQALEIKTQKYIGIHVSRFTIDTRFDDKTFLKNQFWKENYMLNSNFYFDENMDF